MTDFLNTYEQLSSLNEDAKSDAGKRFWAAAKNNKIDEDSFYEAYEEELKQLGLDGIFWPEKRADGTIGIGKLKHRGVYGEIKKAKEANPSSYAVKACAKLWVLQFVEGAEYKVDTLEREERQRKADEIKRREQEKLEQAVQEYRDLLPDALAAIKPEIVQEYLDAYKITKDDIDLTLFKTYNGEYKVALLPTKLFNYHLGPREDIHIRTWLIQMLTSEFNEGIREAKRREEQEKYKSNNAIDVIGAGKGDSRTYCTAVLEGDSGALYYLSVKGGYPNISKTLGTEVTDIKYLLQITEPYKVIYTSVHCDSTFGGRGSSDDYYSWDSSKEALLKPILPEEGSYSDHSMDSTTKRVSKGDGKNLSLMDNIDSWMVRDCRHWSLD